MAVDETTIDRTVKEILNARRIFLEGRGRSGLQAAAFAMRLAQMGIQAYVVSEATTPSIGKDDLLIICSGSGETKSLVDHVEKAKKLQAEVVLFTANDEAKIGKVSKCKVVIPAPKKYENGADSTQPMGTLFEQALGLVLDVTVLELMKQMNLSSTQMYQNHKNLE